MSKKNGTDDRKNCVDISNMKEEEISYCKWARENPPSDDACNISTYTSLTDDLKDTSLKTLVKDYINAKIGNNFSSVINQTFGEIALSQ